MRLSELKTHPPPPPVSQMTTGAGLHNSILIPPALSPPAVYNSTGNEKRIDSASILEFCAYRPCTDRHVHKLRYLNFVPIALAQANVHKLWQIYVCHHSWCVANSTVL